MMESMTAEEFYLRLRAIRYEEDYFKDFTLSKYRRRLSKITVLMDEKWVNTESGIFDDLCWKLDIGEWSFKIIPDIMMKGALGECDIDKKVIRIAESAKKSKSILLHEMIHAYEFTFVKDPFSNLKFYKQIILIDLYNKLSIKISGLKKQLLFNVQCENIIHSPLFMLKSLELDIRLNYPLGKVYGYGKEEILKCAT